MKSISISVLIAFVASLFSNSLNAQQSLGNDTLQLLNSFFKNWNDSTPGGSLTIVRDGDAIFKKSFGKADLEHTTAINDQTVFEAGSVSKQFTAAATLLLANQGKLSLNDDIRKFIPDFPDFGTVISVDHLLHHTSGLKDWSAVVNLSGWPRGTKAYTQAHVLEIIKKQKSLNFKPGTEYSYSNSNYILLTEVVEKASGQKFTEFTRQHLFAPLNMNATQWRDDFRKIVYNRAQAYSKAGKTYVLNMPFESNYGHGGLLTTVNDLIKWNDVWMNNKLGNQLSELREKKGLLASGNMIDYAGGVFVKTYNGKKEISHSGSTAGYRSWLAYYPELKLSVAYLSNDPSNDPENLGEKIKQVFLGTNRKMNPTPVASKTSFLKVLSSLAAVYKNTAKPELIEIEARDTGLFIKNGPQVIAISRDTFSINGLKFIIGKDQFTNSASGEVYIKMPPATLAETDLQALVGKYYSEEAEGEFMVEFKEGKLSLYQHPHLRMNLQPAYKNGFLIMAGERILVEFEKNKKGVVDGLTVNMQRAERIPFRKIR